MGYILMGWKEQHPWKTLSFGRNLISQWIRINQPTEEKGYVKSIKEHRGENPQRDYLTVFENGQDEWLKPQDFDSNVMIERYWKNIKKEGKGKTRARSNQKKW